METASKTVVPPGSGADRADEELIPLHYGALHDLLGPANQLCSLAGLLIRQHRDQLGAEAGAVFDLMEGSAKRLQNLLAGLRSYVQITQRQAPFQYCDANALFASSMSTLQAAIDEAAGTVTHDHLPQLYCDPAQISFVFAAVLENAIKFRSQDPPEIRVSAATAGEMWILSVRDNGIGIDSKQHGRIFEMFKRVDGEKYPGAGVGLTIARRIIQRHDGQIWVESEPGRGATFHFSIPREKSSPPSSLTGGSG